jgi:hypothetical protein
MRAKVSVIGWSVITLCVVAAIALQARPALVVASNDCASQIPVTIKFSVYCDKVRDQQARGLCGRFITNQACKVFPAYRALTGIPLEKYCKNITYRLFDRDAYPHDKGGGISTPCEIHYIAGIVLNVSASPSIGPYEVHEILHQFQLASAVLREMTSRHPLFEVSMVEVKRRIGDVSGYQLSLARLQQSTAVAGTGAAAFTGNLMAPCETARHEIVRDLYLRNPITIYSIYALLTAAAPTSSGGQESYLNRALIDVSRGDSRKLLEDNDCITMEF